MDKVDIGLRLADLANGKAERFKSWMNNAVAISEFLDVPLHSLLRMHFDSDFSRRAKELLKYAEGFDFYTQYLDDMIKAGELHRPCYGRGHMISYTDEHPDGDVKKCSCDCGIVKPPEALKGGE